MHRLFGLLSLLALAGCSTHKLDIAAGHTEIRPTASLEIGHLYFAAEGRRPAFETTDGTTYSELCYDDFDLDPELLQIETYIEDKGVDVAKATFGPSVSLKGDLTAPVIGVLPGGTADFAQTRVVENLRRFELSPAGTQVVWDNIGADCRAEITKQQTAKKNVIILLAAQRADSLTDTSNYGGGITVPTPFGEFGPKGSDKSVTEYKLVYLSGLLSPKG